MVKPATEDSSQEPGRRLRWLRRHKHGASGRLAAIWTYLSFHRTLPFVSFVHIRGLPHTYHELTGLHGRNTETADGDLRSTLFQVSSR